MVRYGIFTGLVAVIGYHFSHKNETASRSNEGDLTGIKIPDIKLPPIGLTVRGRLIHILMAGRGVNSPRS